MSDAVNRTWQMSKSFSELMQHHAVTLSSPQAVALSDPAGSMLLSGFASTLDTDIERVQFAPFAFDPIPANVELRYDHTDQIAGRIETLAHPDRGHDDVANAVAGAAYATSKGKYAYDTTMQWVG